MLRLLRFKSIPEKSLYLLLILNYAYWGLSLLLSHNIAEVFTKDFIRWQIRGFFCFLPLMAWLIVKKPLSEQKGILLVYSLLFPATFVALAGIFTFILGIIPELTSDIEFSLSPMRKIAGEIWFFGLHRSHLAAAGFYLSVITLLTSLLCFWRAKKASLIFFFALLINLWALSYTKARTFLVAYVVATLVIFMISLFTRQRKMILRTLLILIFSFVTIGVSILITEGATERLHVILDKGLVTQNAVSGSGSLLNSLRMDKSLATQNVFDRVTYWKGSVKMILEHPIIGVGLGNFPKEFKRLGYILNITPIKDQMMHAHNSYLHITAELGFIGIILFLSLWAFLLWKLIGLLKYQLNGSFKTSLFAGILAIVVAQSVAALADYNFWSPTIMLPITTLIGIALKMERVDNRERSNNDSFA